MNTNPNDLLHLIPFVGMMTGGHGGRPYLTRLLEQSLPGILVAVVSVYVTDARQDERIQNNKASIERVEKKTENEIQNVRTDIGNIRADIYVPKGGR